MFPLRTTERLHSLPVITWLLIAVNLYVFVQQLAVTDAEAFFRAWGLVPANYPNLFAPDKAQVQADWRLAAPFITSMFLHGGLWHLLGNMLSLFVFGPNVEDRLGHTRYLVTYLACGLAAGVTQIGFSAGSEIPVVGASGAIAGVMGAFFVMFPRAKVISVIPVWIVPFIVQVPAFFFLLFWIGMNLINALAELKLDFTGTENAGVAWWAHIGGFAIGVVYGIVLARRPRPPSESARA